MIELIEHLDVWTAAVETRSTAGRGSSNKLNLYGIKKLRSLILELAVRGQLVAQDPTDEPAAVLLQKIATEKARLIKDGKLKKQEPLPPITDDEKPFELPEGWEFVRVGEVVNVLNGRAYKKHEMLNQGTPLLRVGNLFTSNEWYYSDLELEADKYIDTGDLIYAWSASFGPFIWDGGKVIYHYHIWKLDFFHDGAASRDYLFNYLLAITKSIKASGNGIAMIHMTKERMEKLVIPTPPLAEQHRIVAKVNELMSLCDALESEQASNINAHQVLVENLLSALTNAADQGNFQQTWTRIAAHFDTLFTTEHSIDQLKQTILQLAVMGKLVPQDPTDEPASVLLKKIAAEKVRLVKAGKLKKETPLPPIAEDEKPFELPQGWAWARLGMVLDIASGVTLGRKDIGDDRIELPYLRVANVQRGYLVLGDVKTIEIKRNELSRYQLLKDDLLVTEGGDWDKVGRTAIWDAQIDQCLHQNHILRMRTFIDGISSLWVQMYMNSVAKTYFQAASKQTTNLASINMTQLKNCPFTIPPLAEQHRIVAKVDELMTLCDQIKARIRTAQTTQLHLADVLARQVVG